MVKKIIHSCLLSLLLCLATSSYAQYLSTPDSIIRLNADGQPIRRSYFKYDNNQRQTDVEHYTYNKKNYEWSGTLKEHVDYDANGNVSFRRTSFWDQNTKSWVDMSTEKTTYDNNGNLLAEEVMNWNKLNGLWEGERKQDATFSHFNLPLSQTSYQWSNASNAWQPTEQLLTEYDPSTHQKLSDTRQEWQENNWLNISKTEFLYEGTAPDPTQSIEYEWNGSSWSTLKKSTFTSIPSNADGLRERQTLTQKINPATSSWVNDEQLIVMTDKYDTQVLSSKETWNGHAWAFFSQEKTDVEYDEKGEKIHEEKYSKSGSNDWIGLSLSEILYDDNGNMTSEVSMEWDSLAQTWKGVVNSRMEYNDNNDLLQDQRFLWDTTTRSWFKQSKAFYQYDDKHNKIGETTTSWNPQKNRWEEFYKGKFEYVTNKNGFITSVTEYIWDKDKWKIVQTTNYF